MLSALLFAVLAAGPTDAASDAINRAYDQLSAHRAAADAAGMASHFAADGLLVDSRPAAAISGAELKAVVETMAARSREAKIRVETNYRVERRSVMGDIAVDAGFARTTYTRTGPVPEGTPMPREMLRRFMVTWKRSAEGRWQIVADASFPATDAQWAALKPVEGLKYD